MVCSVFSGSPKKQKNAPHKSRFFLKQKIKKTLIFAISGCLNDQKSTIKLKLRYNKNNKLQQNACLLLT
ncbi:MAG: hypothetical protein IIU35_01635 [Neisseriaceae bacterium]|nr:hypothetical protein [Neisseriaceae bacterium]